MDTDLVANSIVCCKNDWKNSSERIVKAAKNYRGDLILTRHKSLDAPNGPLLAMSNVCIRSSVLGRSKNVHLSCPRHSTNGYVKVPRFRVARNATVVLDCTGCFQLIIGLSYMHSKIVRARAVQTRSAMTDAISSHQSRYIEHVRVCGRSRSSSEGGFEVSSPVKEVAGSGVTLMSVMTSDGAVASCNGPGGSNCE